MMKDKIYVRIIDTPIQWDQLTEKVADPDSGAHGWFVGVTRRTTGSRVTETLAYEAHLPMAKRELEKIAATAIERFSLIHAVIVHRVGEVPVGQASVVVGCSSGHRPATFEALAWIMETLKSEVPIWKREQYVDGSTEWVHPTTSDGDQK